MGLDQIWSGRLGSSNDRLTCPRNRRTVNGVSYSSLPRCSASVVPRRPGDSGYEGICWTPPTPCTYDQMQTCCQRTSYWSTNCRRDNGIARWLVLKIDYEPPSAPPFAFLSPPPPPPLSPPLPPSTPPPPPPPAEPPAPPPSPSPPPSPPLVPIAFTVNWYNYPGSRYGARCYSVPSGGSGNLGAGHSSPEACARAASRREACRSVANSIYQFEYRASNGQCSCCRGTGWSYGPSRNGWRLYRYSYDAPPPPPSPTPPPPPLSPPALPPASPPILYIDQGPGDCVGPLLPGRNQVTRPVTAPQCANLCTNAGRSTLPGYNSATLCDNYNGGSPNNRCGEAVCVGFSISNSICRFYTGRGTTGGGASVATPGNVRRPNGYAYSRMYDFTETWINCYLAEFHLEPVLPPASPPSPPMPPSPPSPPSPPPPSPPPSPPPPKPPPVPPHPSPPPFPPQLLRASEISQKVQNRL